MATEDTNNIIVNLLNDVVNRLNEVNRRDPRERREIRERWTVENVNKLEKNLQVLNADFSKMKGLLIEFQSREKRLPETGERIEGALREALNLIEQQEQERGWCLPCRNPLSSKNIVWKTRFDAVVQELEDTNKIIVKVLNEVNRTEKWTVENVNKLEINLQVLKIDFTRMKGLLILISNQFQSRQKKLPEPVESCLERIDGALRQALVLIDETNREQERGWGLSYRNSLSSKNGVWKTRFDGLLQELQFAISISSNTEQIVPRSQRLLQALPDAYFVERAFQSLRVQLQKWLEENPRKGRKIGVYGRSGVGKTSLLKIIYNYYKKKVSGFFDIFIWVTVSRSFEIEQLQDSIAEALNLSLEGISNAETRKTKLNAPLERKRFLLILDNMSNEIDLSEVGISIGDDNGSKLLISSRNKEVVEKMGAKDFLLEIKPLNSEEGWELFRGRAFAKGVVPENNIETIARNFAEACRGLPLAINAVAATMSSKKTQNDWETALKNMERTNSSFQRIQTNIDAELYQPLRWIFDDLSDLHLNCFLNCEAFLGDKEIPVETLVQMWDAEAETPYLMDAGRHCIKELVNRCLLECVEYIVDDDYHSVEYLKIHEALRDMAINIGSQRNEKFLFLAGQKLQNFPGKRDTSYCRRISVDHTAIKDLPNDFESSELKSLVLASNNKLEKIPDKFFSNIESLKILDLSSTSIGTLPDLQQLQQLKFLNLASCTKLVELHDSLCILSNLQVLNLSSCLALCSLPSEIGKLKNLKHLKLDACYSLNELPKNLSQLTSLNTLSLPLMGSICAVSVEDLSKLSNLTELTTVVKSENKVDTEVVWLEMRNLTLEYDADADAERGCVAPEHVILQKMGHMKKLQNFHLINYQGGTLPISICEFQNMKLLLLHSCYQLKALPALDKNRSESADDRSDSAGYSFPILEKLVLRNLLKLESLAGSSEIWNEGTMSKLQFLVIINCPSLKKLPSGMKLPYLKELHITMCNELMELDIGSDGFPMLEMLTLDELNKLERIADPATVWTEGTMSKLQILEVIDCPLLKTLPKGMEKLSSLKQINGELDWWQRISWPDDKLETSLGKLFMII